MRITSTAKDTRHKTQDTRLQFKIQNFKFWVVVFTFYFLLLPFSSGCTKKKDDLEEAEGYLKQSEAYYQRAINSYTELIAKGQDSERLHFELGKLYYDHRDFKRSIAELKKTNVKGADKFLAISYYCLGNFTDALEAFNKIEAPDDECLYYYGLTSEKLNLFDKALDSYKKIKSQEFSLLASERINIIEKQVVKSTYIKDINPLVADILDKAPSEDEYPQAGALILYCDEKVEITEADTQVTSLHYVIKILNERGKEDFSETHIGYDSTFEKVELEYARIIKPDGEVVEVGSKHIRDVSKYLNFPLYSNARVYIISFPEITEGVSIEYKLKLHRNQLINKKDFVIAYPVQTSEPVIAAGFTIDLPQDKPLHIKKLNDRYNNFAANLEPQKTQEGGRLIYRWQFKDLPQIIPESNMPPNVEINPSFLISTFSSWQEVYDWWWNLAKDKIKSDDAIRTKVGDLVQGKNNDEEKIRAIYNFCAQKIRYVAVEYGQAGYEPHPAYDIFKNKYGDCKDQAVLLVTMLKEANFSAWLVLIPTKEDYNLNEDFPSIIFNHCIAAVSLNDKIFFLDPTAETCSFGDLPVDDQARKVLIFKEAGYEIQNTPLYPAEHNLIKQSLRLKVNSDESIAAERAVFSYGMYDQAQRAWLLYTPPVLIEETLKEKIQGVSIGAKLDNYNINNLENLNVPIELSYSFRGPEYFTLAGNARIMPQLSGLDASLVAKDSRQFPIDFAILDSKETTFEVELPDNFAIKYMPTNINEESPWLKFIAEYNHKGNKIYFRQKVELKANTISEQEYPDFKAFFEGLAQKIKQRIILTKSK
ncbi:MAG: DUF3857 domain-containing protein [Candidatus Omnitrophica bacterium]|nr:DUF3857 domain-containing protein [Candidatus Omnitrophota bacterium]